MPDVNLRKFVTDALSEVLPNWVFYPYARTIDAPQSGKVYGVLSIQTVEREPATNASSKGALRVTYTLSIIESQQLPGPSDNAIDDDLIDALNALDASKFQWNTATRAVTKSENGYPAFDITLQIHVSKD